MLKKTKQKYPDHIEQAPCGGGESTGLQFAEQSASALIPQDEASRRVLKARALLIAKPYGEGARVAGIQYLCFRLGEVELYGIHCSYLEELLYAGNPARVPGTPAFIAGVINYRGQLLTLLDIKQFFRMPATSLSNEARIIVVVHAGMRVGLLVDAVEGDREYRELSAAFSSDGVTNMAYVEGIHEGCVTILKLSAILDDPQLKVTG